MMKRGSRLHRFFIAWYEFSIEFRIGPDEAWLEIDRTLPAWPWRLYCWRHGHTLHERYPRMGYCFVCHRKVR